MGDVSSWHIQQYNDDFTHEAQQTDFRLAPLCRAKGKREGKKFYFNILDPSSRPEEKTTRNPDTPSASRNHRRRAAVLRVFHNAEQIDSVDEFKAGNHVDAPYLEANVMMYNREKDHRVIEAAFAPALEGEEGERTIAFPTTQVITHTDTGLTLAKIKATKKRFDKAEVSDARRYFVISSEQDEDLFEITEVINSDYNDRVMIDGKVTYFMGFHFIRSELLTTDPAGGYRRCIGAVEGAIGCSPFFDLHSDVRTRHDKSDAKEIYQRMSFATSRLLDKHVIEIQCVED